MLEVQQESPLLQLTAEDLHCKILRLSETKVKIVYSVRSGEVKDQVFEDNDDFSAAIQAWDMFRSISDEIINSTFGKDA